MDQLGIRKLGQCMQGGLQRNHGVRPRPVKLVVVAWAIDRETEVQDSLPRVPNAHLHGGVGRDGRGRWAPEDTFASVQTKTHLSRGRLQVPEGVLQATRVSHEQAVAQVEDRLKEASLRRQLLEHRLNPKSEAQGAQRAALMGACRGLERVSRSEEKGCRG